MRLFLKSGEPEFSASGPSASNVRSVPLEIRRVTAPLDAGTVHTTRTAAAPRSNSATDC
eukprot:CAMPEP_0181482956 /NCGR_PEP_ID=MMETSP1110-20121109/45153_1 /TAXON_ID=174948 /ORGANISM="Symbiodinium sp., Strain CCMP421" /LENGTH=58 /DNA_ID=CAMNT_0023608613 /DNA_START=65 /DNA_END=238 /DNA_ORIENTATION=+